MLNTLQLKAIAVQTAIVGYIAGALEQKDRGQSSVEYAGIILVAVAIIVVLIGAASGWGDAITSKIGDAIDSF